MTRITRMDTSTPEQWAEADAASAEFDAGVADRILLLLAMQAGVDDGFAVDQLTHGLQTATRAERAGADDEVVVAALLHDLGKFAGDDCHDAVAGEILRPYVRTDVYNVVRYHQDFTARHMAHVFGGDPERRARWRDEAWFALAERFVDDWDQVSFDPRYDTEPLEHFLPLVRRVFAVT